MFTQSFPLLVAGVATRIGANHVVRRRLSLRIDIPQGLASTHILTCAHTQAAEFTTLVERLMVELDTPESLARLYNALLARQLPDIFSAKTLNIAQDATAVMQRIHDSSWQVTLDQLEEHLNEMGVNAIPEANLIEFVNNTLRGNANSLRHMMAGLGWAKSKVKWGGVDYARAIWIRPEITVDREKLHGPDGTSEAITQHLGRDEPDITM